jgi:hypothetical protein
VFTARYALSPYIKQIRFVFKGLISVDNAVYDIMQVLSSCSRVGVTDVQVCIHTFLDFYHETRSLISVLLNQVVSLSNDITFIP